MLQEGTVETNRVAVTKHAGTPERKAGEVRKHGNSDPPAGEPPVDTDIKEHPRTPKKTASSLLRR